MAAPADGERVGAGAPAGHPGPPPTVRYTADVVVTMDPQTPLLLPGAVDVAGDRIVAVGPVGDRAPAGATVVPLGGLLMPGLVNTHAHSPMTLVRGAGDGLALDRWLREVVWPREGRMTGEDAAWGMTLGAAEMLRNGVTTTCEQYLHSASVAGAAVAAGIRCVLTPGVFDLPDAGPDATWQRFLADAAALHAELDGCAGRLTVGIGPHAAYTLPEEGLVAVAELAAERDLLVQIHLAETRHEDRAILARTGLSAPAYLARLGLLDCRVLAAHSVWLSDADLDCYAEHDVAVAHCPQSNGKLGSGVAPVAEMLRRGLRVGLGTDGPASNDNLDLWEELRLAPVLARATSADPAALSTFDALALATSGGAAALGLAAGRLAPGCLADLVRLDLEDAAFIPGNGPEDLLAHLVWAAGSRHVTDVWVGGERVVVAGRCLTVDEPAAQREVAARARRIAGAQVGP